MNGVSLLKSFKKVQAIWYYSRENNALQGKRVRPEFKDCSRGKLSFHLRYASLNSEQGDLPQKTETFFLSDILICQLGSSLHIRESLESL